MSKFSYVYSCWTIPFSRHSEYLPLQNVFIPSEGGISTSGAIGYLKRVLSGIETFTGVWCAEQFTKVEGGMVMVNLTGGGTAWVTVGEGLSTSSMASPTSLSPLAEAAPSIRCWDNWSKIKIFQLNILFISVLWTKALFTLCTKQSTFYMCSLD